MKALIISHMYPSSLNEAYGIFVHEQVKALSGERVEIQVVSPVPFSPFPLNLVNRKWKAYSELPKAEFWEGIKVHRPRYLAFPKGLFFESSGYRMFEGIKKVVEEIYSEFKFELIHAHTALPDGFAALMIKKKYEVPLVVTVHGQDLLVTIHKNLGCKKALEKVFEGADEITLVSSKLKQLAQSEFGLSNKLTVVNNGVSLGKIEGIRPRSGFNGKEPTILSVSNLVKSKGVDLNLLAVFELKRKGKKLNYLIVGSGPEERNLKKLTKKLQLEKQVKFLGRLPHEEALKYMSKADIFSLPSWREGFGVVYLEAMAFGKPVIACRGEGIEDVIEDGENGILVEPQDLESLIRAIEFLINNPQEAQVMGKRASEKVLKELTWEKNALKTKEVYEKVLRKYCRK
jgi:hypothetical protein